MQCGLAVVTGASSGIGAEVARQLPAVGYSLLLIARQKVASAVGGASILVADLERALSNWKRSNPHSW